MPTLDKILIPIDFSPATEDAIDYGKRIAAQFGRSRAAKGFSARLCPRLFWTTIRSMSPTPWI